MQEEEYNRKKDKINSLKRSVDSLRGKNGIIPAFGDLDIIRSSNEKEIERLEREINRR